MKPTRQFFVYLVLTCLLLPVTSYAQWQETGVPVCTVTDDEERPCIASDGEGGAIIVWQTEYRYPDIYAQRVDAEGYLLWTAGGVAICTASDGQYGPRIVTDGAGGAIVFWYDFRNGNLDIYAQRIDADGNSLWITDGIPICTASNSNGWWQTTHLSVLACTGGAFITWHDDRSGNSDIYAQRINTAGEVQWTPNGIAVCANDSIQTNPVIVSDGGDGFIAAWQDMRNGDLDIYAQKVDADGVVQWTLDGIAVCTATGDQEDPAITTDGAEGAILSWEDGSWEESDIYAQRINGSGVILWATRGVAICTAIKQQIESQLIPDCSGGAIITWADQRNSPWWDHEIYVQRINGDGNVLWTENGMKISDQYAFDHICPQIIPDGFGGAVICWITGEPLPGRSALTHAKSQSDTIETVYAQRIAVDGTIFWREYGLPLCSYPDLAQIGWYPELISDGSGGAIVTWYTGYRYNGIYAQRVNGNGSVPPTEAEIPPPALTLSQNYPNPFNPRTSIRYYLPVTCHVRLAVYDVTGNLVDILVNKIQETGRHVAEWDGCDRRGIPAASGVYVYTITAGNQKISRKLVLLR